MHSYTSVLSLSRECSQRTDAVGSEQLIKWSFSSPCMLGSA